MPIVIIEPSDPGNPSPDAGYTRDDLVEEVLSSVQGFTAAPDQLTYLTGDVSVEALSLTVADTSGVANGLVEVGDELIWITGFDANSGTLQVLPKGRGFRGTDATAHLNGDTVALSPTIPRAMIAREINNQLRNLYPSLYAVRSSTFTFSDPTQAGWTIPAEAEGILDVRYLDFLGNWERVRCWECEHTPNEAPVVRFTGVPIGRDVQVVYSTRPSTLDSGGALVTDCGLLSGARDLLVLGALARLIPMLDVARLGVQYAAADELANPRPLGSAVQIGREFQSRFDKRLEAEKRALSTRFPARIHFTR